MRVLVCGGRYFRDVPRLWRRLDEITARDGISTIIEGASDDVAGPYIGADYWAHQWALARDCETIRCHADWVKHGKAAGPIRNAEMLKMHSPDLVLATEGGNGTFDMIKKAQAAGILVERC